MPAVASGLFLRYSCGQMRLATALACFVCLGFAQNSANLDSIHYPPLAVAAGVHGDVLISGGNAVSGPPLLRETARRGADLLNLQAPRTDVLFHFIPNDIIRRVETINKGNAFDRFFLRLFRMPTTKKIEYNDCAAPPGSRVDSTKHPIEVWIYQDPCVLKTD
jgi:hypothetical protein